MKQLEEMYPTDAALDFDNVGLLVGRSDKEVKKIYIALDATEDVIEDAIGKNVDMLITHHPMIFDPLKSVTSEHFTGRRIIDLIKYDISYYAMHTNYDVMGMAGLAGRLFELQEPVVLEETYWDRREGMNTYARDGIGRVGRLTHPMSLKETTDWVKEKLHLEQVKVFGDMKQEVSVMAVSPGSGKSMIDAALEKGADVLVTGDIDHHAGIDAVAKGIAIIDAGHYGTEYIFMEDVKSYLKDSIDGVEIETAEFCLPFQII
nr:Nif3-like dinuclear metal center hexameric protein [Hespellia stercorisuis]